MDIATRLIIAALALTYIFYRIYTLPAGQVNTFFDSVLHHKNVTYLVTALVVLMLINWGTESLKWKLLIAQSEKIKFLNAYQAILGGLAVSIFTPNRVGEFMGRVFILKKTDPVKAILLTVVGSFSQLLVTIVAGTAAYVVFAPKYIPAALPESFWLVKGFSVTLVIVSIIMLIAFFNIRVLHRISILVPAKYSERIRNSIDALAGCPKQLLLKTFLLSAFRYIVFSVQFFLSIRLMELNFTFTECLQVIPVMYLVLAAIPTAALTELGVRGSVAVFLFALLGGSTATSAEWTLAIISATTLIWLLNIALPSLAGVLVVFRLKFFGR
jgi:hypothetical protein